MRFLIGLWFGASCLVMISAAARGDNVSVATGGLGVAVSLFAMLARA